MGRRKSGTNAKDKVSAAAAAGSSSSNAAAVSAEATAAAATTTTTASVVPSKQQGSSSAAASSATAGEGLRSSIPAAAAAAASAKQRKKDASAAVVGTTAATTAVTTAATAGSLHEWLVKDSNGPLWVIGCMVIGIALGFAVGAGRSWFWFLVFGSGGSGSNGEVVRQQQPPWKQNLANRIRTTGPYQFATFRGKVWDDWLDRFAEWAENVEKDIEAEEYAKNPSHPRVFAVLREAVVREKGGYVHPDLGFQVPAPSGAARGIGMVRDGHHACQVRCLPGTGDEKRTDVERLRNGTLAPPGTPPASESEPRYRQEEVLIKVPLAFQMTRSVALDTLTTVIPGDVQKKANLHELDDAALLVLFLANERGVGRHSRWTPYIASMPPQPSCGYSEELRPHMLDATSALEDEVGVDVQGWPAELLKATQYAQKIAAGLNADYGPHVKRPDRVSSYDNIRWALCQVASRATAGSDEHGSLRLVPVVDLINHDANAGGFVELTGKERLQDNGGSGFIDATEDDSGTFVVRSIRHGRRKPLRKGQELLANYNVPLYSPLDWFVSMGFVPPERWGQWRKVDPVLPRVRTDGPFSEDPVPTEEAFQARSADVIEALKSADLQSR